MQKQMDAQATRAALERLRATRVAKFLEIHKRKAPQIELTEDQARVLAGLEKAVYRSKLHDILWWYERGNDDEKIARYIRALHQAGLVRLERGNDLSDYVEMQTLFEFLLDQDRRSDPRIPEEMRLSIQDILLRVARAQTIACALEGTDADLSPFEIFKNKKRDEFYEPYSQLPALEAFGGLTDSFVLRMIDGDGDLRRECAVSASQIKLKVAITHVLRVQAGLDFRTANLLTTKLADGQLAFCLRYLMTGTDLLQDLGFDNQYGRLFTSRAHEPLPTNLVQDLEFVERRFAAVFELAHDQIFPKARDESGWKPVREFVLSEQLATKIEEHRERFTLTERGKALLRNLLERILALRVAFDPGTAEE